MTQKRLDDIISHTNIVSVISRHVRLKHNGDVAWYGLCPFHMDKKGSFYVIPIPRARSLFKCFDCQESGDVLTFVMKYLGLSMVGAAKYLEKIDPVSEMLN